MRTLRTKDLILGTMKSAKSAQLIMRGYLLDEQGKHVLTFAPEKNTRDGAFVTSRALPIKRPATVIGVNCSKKEVMESIYISRPDVILIDELQFFTIEQVEAFAEASLFFDIDIYAYGLMMSYNGRMFESIKRALECGFKMQTIDMACDDCGNDATHHLLYEDGVLVTGKDDDGIIVEDDNFKKKKHTYKSVCFACFQKAIDLADRSKK